MQTLFIGFVVDTVSPVSKGLAIRIAYLLSSRLRLAGTISDYYTMSEDIRTISIEQKAKFIDEQMAFDTDREKIYDSYRDFQKIYNREGRNRKEFIVAKARLEKSIHDMFDILVDNIAAMLKDAGLADLKLIKESTSYGEYYIHHKDAENDDYNKLSDALQLNLDDEDNKYPTIFVLTGGFFSAAFNPGIHAMPAINGFSDKGFLQELFTFPDYNCFSINDLLTIRFEAGNSILCFQEAVNTFATLHERPMEAFAHLHNEVIAAATALAAGINRTRIITGNKQVSATVVEAGRLYLGMVPHNLVFKYFEYIKATRENTITILADYPTEKSNQFVPVLIVASDVDIDVEEEPGISAALPLKKTLSID